MIRRLQVVLVCAAFAALIFSSSARAQVVDVTLSLDKKTITVGETATLRAFAQIVPAQRANSDRIFSWYLDALNPNAAVASLDPSGLLKTTSDKKRGVATVGIPDGANLRGIFDTFMNLPAAGRDTAAELFSIPVKGLAVGKVLLEVKRGSGLAGIAHDFIAAPAGGGDPLTGGNYTTASIELEVKGASFERPAVTIAARLNPQNQTREITLQFPVAAGRNHIVESSPAISPNATWLPLPGAPHNSGQAIDSASASQRFYRVRVE